MASDVAICKLALSHIGDEATITSIDPPEGSEQAEHCQTFYPVARNTVLESHTWGVATRRIALVERTEDPPADWTFVYQRPNNVLKCVSVLAPGALDSDDTEEFVEETLGSGVRVIYTNVEEATLRFIVLEVDTTKYSALMVNAIARLLASYLAGPVIKGETGMRVGLAHRKIYEDVELPQAKAADSNARKKNTYDKFVPASVAARR